MDLVPAMIAAPLAVRVCGAIRPRKMGDSTFKGVRHFVASGVVVYGSQMLWLSTRENQVLQAIVADANRTQRATMHAFVGEADEDGGPEFLGNAVWAAVLQTRTKLRTVGLDLVRNGHPQAPFMLCRLDAAQASEAA